MSEHHTAPLDPETLTPAILELRQTTSENLDDTYTSSVIAINDLSRGYSDVTLGVRAAIQSGANLETLRKSPVVVGELAMQYATYLQEFVIDRTSVTPEYIKSYLSTRSHALDRLLGDATRKKNFSLAMDTIQAFNDPGLAIHFINTMHASKKPETFGRMSISMDRDRIQDMMKAINRASSNRREALKQYSEDQFRQTIQERYTRGEISQIETMFAGLSRALGLGPKRYIRDKVIGPLEEIAMQPPISEQVLTREMQI